MKLHNEELHDLWCSPDIVRVTKRWGMWHVWGRRKMHTGLGGGGLNGRNHLEDLVLEM